MKVIASWKKHSLALAAVALVIFISIQYPVAQAATLGNTTPGVSSAASPNTASATRFTMTNENGTLTALSVYFTSAALAPNNLFQAAVYADSAGVPGALVAASATQGITVNIWNTVSVSGSLSANTVYWLAVNTNGSSAASYNSSANSSYSRSQTFGTMPSTFGAGAVYPVSISIYATYTASAAAIDTAPPSVSLSAPVGGTTVSGSVTVSANASDNIGVAGVQFQVDGSNIGSEDNSAPYSIAWDTSAVSNTSHTLTAIARDTSDNVATSAGAPVTVSNTITPTPTPTPTPPATGSWVAPIGISTPTFGINEQAPASPSPWTSEVTNFYYIDRGVAGATDTNNTYGTPSKPRMSIPRTLAAGAVVELHGTYTFTHTSPNTITSSGTANSPVFIRGVSINQKPIVTNCFQVGGSYFIVENIEFGLVTSCGAKAQVAIMAGATYGSIRNSDVHGTLNNGGLNVSGSTNSVVYNNYIHDNGDINATFDQDVHGIGVGTGTTYLWVMDNEIARNSGDGSQINGNSYIDTNPATSRTHHIYYGRNRVHHNKQVAFGTKQASDVIYSQNTMYSHRSSGSSQGGCTSLQYGPERVWYLYNDCYDSERGFSFASNSGPDGVGQGQNLYAIGNVINNIHLPSGADLTNNVWKSGAAFYLSDESATKYIINNSVYDADVGITNPRGSDSFQAYNNIFRNIIAEDVFLESGTQANASQMNNNIFDAQANIKWGNVTQLSLSQFRSTYPSQCSACLEANPLYVNETGGNFHLQFTSPAVNSGVLRDVYQTFQNQYGLSIAVDYDKNSRPVGSAWDIGAYEYGGTVQPPVTDTQAPSVPAGLTATAVSSIQINLSWTVSTDNVGVSGYRIYRAGTQIDTSATNSYSNTGLTASTSYTYTVAAYDAAGNVSSQSTSSLATTQNVTPTNQAPVGTFDEIRLSDGVIRAWSYDPDAASTSNQIHIYINGVAGAGGTLLTGYTSDILRSDVNTNFGITGNHGIEYTIPAQYRDGVSHTIYIYGVDTSNSAISTLLSGSPKSFNLNSGIPATGDLYVDGQITSASCTTYNPATRSCSNGNSRAYQTMNAASAAAVAGNTVFIRGGTYSAQFAPSTSGSSGNYITFKNYTGESPIISGVSTQAILAINRSYLAIEGLIVNNVASYGRLEDSTNVIIRNNTFSGSTGSGTTSGFKLLRGDHYQIIGNNISGGADSMTVIDSNYNLFLNNTYGSSAHSELTIRCGNYNIIRGNTFSNSTQKSGEVYDCEQSSSDAPFKLDAAHGNIWEDNKFTATAASTGTNNYQGIQFAGQNGIVRRNVFHDNLGGALGIAVYPQEATWNYKNRIYNNTFYNNRCYAIVGANDVDPTHFYDVLVRNNLMYQNFDCSGGGTSQNQILNTAAVVLSNNLVTATDPLFVNAAGRDLHLQTGSAAVNSGSFLTTTVSAGSGVSMPVTDAQYFYEGYSIPGEIGDTIQLSGQTQTAVITAINRTNNTLTLSNPLTWSNGQGVSLVYSGSAPDMGAYEYGGAVTNPTTATVTVAKTGLGSGTVTGTGINCGTDCTETVNVGTSITLTALAATGSTFAGWSGGSCSGTGSCNVTIPANTAVSAIFNTTVSANQAPVGTFDEIRLSDGVIRAWSYDPDAASTSNQIHIYINGVAGAGGTLLTGYTSDILRSDVNTNFGITGNHGIEYTIPAQYRDGVSHTIYIYGVDTSNSAISSLLSGSPKSFTINPPDTTIPTVSITAPVVGATVSGSSTTVSATASDNVGVLGVQFKLDGVNLGAEDTSSPYTITWNTTQTSNGSHILTVVARDAAGNTATSASRAVTVNNAVPVPSDFILPSVPSGLTASSISSSQVNLSWTASTDNVGVVGYNVFRNGSEIATAITATTYQDIGLSPSTLYTYRILSYDAANNRSAQSIQAQATTQDVPPSGGGGGTNPTPTPTPVPTPGQPVSSSNYPSGMFIKYSSDPTVYLLSNGTKLPITDWTVYQNRVPSSRSIITISDTVTFPTGNILGLRSGSLIKSVSSPTVYLFDGSNRLAFTSSSDFLSLGYRFNQVNSINDDNLFNGYPVINISKSTFSRPQGTLFKYASSPTIYYLDNQTKKAFTSLFMFKAWYDRLDQVVTIADTETFPNATHVLLPNGAVVKLENTSSYYIIVDGKVRPISSNFMNSMGVQSTQVLIVSQDDLNRHGDMGAEWK